MSDPREQLRMYMEPPSVLVQGIARVVDQYVAANQGVSVVEVLSALEFIRYWLTEDLIITTKVRR